MRIVGGAWRGRPIKAPEGRDTRPTQDRVRESVASMVFSDRGGIEGISVLDAFAGSGALSLEMLSRGAGHATMVDLDQRSVGCIRANLAALGVGRDRACVLKGDVLASASRSRMPGAPFDVVFLDPPYALAAARVAALLEALAQKGSLSEGALVIYERDARSPHVEARGFVETSSRSVGTTAVDALHWYGEEKDTEDGR